MTLFIFSKLYEKSYYYQYQINNQNKNPDNNNKFLSGLIAGLIGAFTVYPIDVIKTRMQNQVSTNKLYSNGFDCCKKLWKSDGLLGFYRGCLIQLFGVGPEKAVKLYAYSFVVNDSKNRLIDHIAGGICAGACQVMITCPYEMIKINMQMNNKIEYTKLYTGVSACFLRDIPFSGLYFPTYWFLKEKLNYNVFLSGTLAGIPATFLAGTLAGIPAAFLCTPADVVKTRMQTLRYNNINIKMIPTIKSIYYNEGLTAFFKGSGWRVFRSSPQFGITLFIYEYLK
jgi:solute carrier family 25 (mitochondrial aspartate/glutamate transporter), member 12/13